MFPLKEVTVQLVYPWNNVSNITVNHLRTDHFSYDSKGNPVHGYNSIDSFIRKNDLSYDMVEFGMKKEVISMTTIPYSSMTTIPYSSMTTIPYSYLMDSVNMTTVGTFTSSTPTETTLGNETSTVQPSTTPFVNTPTVLPTNHSLIPATNTSDHVYVSSAPDLKWLVLVPLLPFILFAYIRNIRKLGSVSLMANIAIFFGYFSILIYMLFGKYLKRIFRSSIKSFRH
jgi:hypothetical protein